MAKVTITKSAQIISVDQDRRGKKDTIVTFTTDGGQPNFVILPSDKPTYAEIQTAINGFYKSQEHVGKTFETL